MKLKTQAQPSHPPSPEPPVPPLTLGAARAALASGAAQATARVLAIVLSIATARALEPHDVGILGLSVIVIGVISMIGFYPETAAVAAPGNADHGKHALAAAGVRALLVGLLLVALNAVYSLVAGYLTVEGAAARELRKLIDILVWVPVLELACSYPQVVLQRRLDLAYVARIGILQPVVFVGLAIFLLINGHGYIGVAWANVIGTITVTVFLWARLAFQGWAKWDGLPDRRIWKSVIGGTARVFAGGFGGYVGERMDNLLVAGALGPAAMGFYSMAWSGSRVPAFIFARAINFVLVPTVARIKEDRERVARAIRECLRHSYFLLAPMCMLLFVSAPALVGFVLGEKWLPLVPALRIMSFTVLTAPALFASGAVLVGTGRAHLVSLSTAVHLIVLLVAIPPLAANWGVVGAAYGDLAATVLSTATLWTTARVSTGFFDRSAVYPVFMPILAALTAGPLALVGGLLLSHGGVARAASEAGLALAGYLGLAVLFGGRNRMIDLANILTGALRRRAVAAGTGG